MQSTDNVKMIFVEYLSIDVTEGWTWNNYDANRARIELNMIAKKRGDIAHRTWRPINGETAPYNGHKRRFARAYSLHP
jgi:hypothetical protein